MMKGLPQSFRWAICFTLAIGLHGAAALLARWTDHADTVANAPVIMIDLAPVAVAPTIIPNDMPPDIVESKLAEPTPEPEPEKPVEKIEMKPDPAPQPELTAVPPPPKPVEKKVEKKKQPRREASIARAASSADSKAERSAAPMPGATGHNADAEMRWNAQLAAQIARHKPASNTESGAVLLAFSIDRNGGVHNARVMASSGSNSIDREALAMLQRAQPLPPPPQEVPGSMIPKRLPVIFKLG